MRLSVVALSFLGCTSGHAAPLRELTVHETKAPSSHRAAPRSCTTERGVGFIVPGIGGTCSRHADCNAGKNGRCVIVGPSWACSYDECTDDHDCGAGVCACRITELDPNRCLRGNCRVDADCDAGKGWCSGSGNDLPSGCTEGPPPGSFGFFCRTPADECSRHEDCGASTRCMFDPGKRHWRCLEVFCKA